MAKNQNSMKRYSECNILSGRSPHTTLKQSAIISFGTTKSERSCLSTTKNDTNKRRCNANFSKLSKVALAFVCLYPALISAAAAATTTTSSSSSSSSSSNSGSMSATTTTRSNHQKVTISTSEMDAGQQRIAFVRHILTDRLDYVQSGKRTADFRKWIQEQGSDVKIKSFHGVEVDWESVKNNDKMKEEKQKELSTALVRQDYSYDEDKNHALVHALQRNDPFAADRLDLDLPAYHQLPSLYEGVPTHVMDNSEPGLVQLCWRTVQLSLKFAPVLSTTFLAVVSSKFRGVWYKWVAASLGSTSAAFIKWGQWASTRTDMFPDRLCYELEQLQSSAPKHPWSFSEQMMESSLGLPTNALWDVFDDFDREPLASGSIAQVYKAQLAGKPVAVKIRHPRVMQLIDMDFRIMTAFARICDYIPALSWLHIRESVEQFSHTMAAQAHLQVEGHHLEMLNHNFRKWPSVNFPHPIYASSAVIIETFEPGAITSDVIDSYEALAAKRSGNPNSKSVSVVEVEGYEDNPISRKGQKWSGSDLFPVETAKFIVTTGLSLYLKMLLVDNLMHADLHPGNIMVAAIDKDECGEIGHDMERLVIVNTDKASNALIKKTTLRICLVDAGMVAQLSEHESTTFIGLLASLGQGNGRLAAKFAARFSSENNLSPEEEEAFAIEMDALFQRVCRGYGSNVDVGAVLRGVLGLIRDHRVRIDANYATLIVNCLCIQSLAAKVCPSYNVLDASEPLLRSYFETFYEPDGTPKPVKAAKRKFKRLMPLKYFQKSWNDRLFFSQLRKNQETARA